MMLIGVFKEMLSRKLDTHPRYLYDSLFSITHIKSVVVFLQFVLTNFTQFLYFSMELQNENFERAVSILSKVVQKHKNEKSDGFLETIIFYVNLLISIHNYKKAKFWARQLEKKAIQKNSSFYFGFAQLLFGKIYLKEGKLLDAYESLKTAHRIFTHLNLKYEEIITLYYFGQLFYAQDKYENAFRYFKKALSASYRNPMKYGQLLDDIAATYLAKGDYLQAKKFLLASLKREKYFRVADLAYVYYDLSELYFQTGNLEESKVALEKAMKYAEMSNNEPLITACFSLFSQLMRLEDKWDTAIEYSKRSLKLQEKLGNNEIIADTLMNIVILNLEGGRKSEAIKYLRLLEEKARETYSVSYQYACMILEAEIKGYDRDYKEAKNLIKKAIKYFEKEKDLHMLWYSKLELANTLISLNEIELGEREIKDVIASTKAHDAIVPLIRCYLVLGAVKGYKTEFSDAKANVNKAIQLSKQCGFMRYVKDGEKLLANIRTLESAWIKYYDIGKLTTQKESFYLQSLNLIKSYIKKAKKIVSSSLG